MVYRRLETKLEIRTYSPLKPTKAAAAVSIQILKNVKPEWKSDIASF